MRGKNVRYEEKLLPVADDMTVYLENSRKSAEKFLYNKRNQ